MSGNYQNALQSALAELSQWMEEREKLDNRREELDLHIFRLREGLFGLAILCGTDTNQLAVEHPELFPDLISPDVGLTDAVRKALASKRNFASPVEVRDRLQAMGYDISKYGNILASIHTILKRLVDSKEVDTGNREGKVVYRWNPKVPVMPTQGAGISPRQSFLSKLTEDENADLAKGRITAPSPRSRSDYLRKLAEKAADEAEKKKEKK